MTIVVDNPKLEQDIPIDRIHVDPFQPRIQADADLADSIRSEGILQAILLERIDASNSADRICPDCGQLFVDLAADGLQFMVQDGERRYRGTLAAGGNTVLAKIVPPVSAGRRLIRQLTANSGKPLTPIEEAFAFQRIMESEEWSQAELARQLKRPRSVVGDRVRLIELDPVWLDLISSGKLQISHAPYLHPYISVPAKYQAAAAKQIVDEWLDDIRNETVPVDEFQFAVEGAFAQYLTFLADVSPQYHGPIVEVKELGAKRTYAADPDIWKPIAAAKAKRAKQEGKTPSTARTQSAKPKGPLDQIPDLARRKAGAYSHDYRPANGEIKLWSEHGGWDPAFRGVPAVFLADVDRTKLARVDFSYSGAMLVTTDAAAVQAARTAFAAELKSRVDSEVVELVGHISKHMSRFVVKGPGTRTLLEGVSRFRSPLPMLALATGVKVEGLPDEHTTVKPGSLRISDADADYLATAYVATLAGAVKVTTVEDLTAPLWRKYSNAPIKFPASKNQEKREARAAGKPVGDPKRAKKEKQVPIAKGSDRAVDVGAMRAAVEAGAIDSMVESEEHAELVEA